MDKKPLNISEIKIINEIKENYLSEIEDNIIERLSSDLKAELNKSRILQKELNEKLYRILNLQTEIEKLKKEIVYIKSRQFFEDSIINNEENLTELRLQMWEDII